MTERTQRWSVVVLFAVAMAWVEAAVVLYLRTLVNRIDPYQPRPMPDMPGLVGAEIVREAATMVMLASLGWLAGRTIRSRFGYLLIAFGIWDIFYYVFLKVLTGWPHSLLDWDILFLIPLPWWGPVIAPTLVAALMIISGTFFTGEEQPLWPGRRSQAFCVLGILLVLGAFMFDALALCFSGASMKAIQEWLPHSFQWLLFSTGFICAACPAIDVALQYFARNGLQTTSTEITT
jgi:hypothetical protein